MTWSLLLPAMAAVVALVALAGSFRRVDRELSDLRSSLRRAQAAAVAGDDLERAAVIVAGRAATLERSTRTRLHRRRSRRRAGHR